MIAQQREKVAIDFSILDRADVAIVIKQWSFRLAEVLDDDPAWGKEDCLIHLQLAVVCALPRYQERNALLGYVKTVCTSEVKDAIRKKQRRNHRKANLKEYELLAVADQDPTNEPFPALAASMGFQDLMSLLSPVKHLEMILAKAAGFHDSEIIGTSVKQKRSRAISKAVEVLSDAHASIDLYATGGSSPPRQTGTL